MKVDRLAIDGPLLLTPALYADDRGWFCESWNRRRFAEALGLGEAEAPQFVQDNYSRSLRGVLRGLHYQREPHPQGKLVRCSWGRSSTWQWTCAATRPASANGWGCGSVPRISGSSGCRWASPMDS